MCAFTKMKTTCAARMKTSDRFGILRDCHLHFLRLFAGRKHLNGLQKCKNWSLRSFRGVKNFRKSLKTLRIPLTPTPRKSLQKLILIKSISTANALTTSARGFPYAPTAATNPHHHPLQSTPQIRLTKMTPPLPYRLNIYVHGSLCGLTHCVHGSLCGITHFVHGNLFISDRCRLK